MSKRLFVGNLSFQVTEQELLDAFAEWGASEVAIPINEAGRSRGFGFVEVDDDKAADAIQAMNGAEIKGREVVVNEARAREDRGGGSRWGGGSTREFGGYESRGGRGGGGRRDRW
jgi:RNA recognition motif-containing protein